MKNSILSIQKLFLLCFFCALGVDTWAQAPQGIPYQAVARSSSGSILASQAISLRFTIHDATTTGSMVYQETFAPSTNSLGLFNVNVGTGSVVGGTFSSINWGVNAKYLQVEMDPAGGTSYTDMGTTQMMSVPYALYAASSGGAGGGWTTAGSNIYNSNSGNVGINNNSPVAQLQVTNGAVLFDGVTGTTPVSGPGTRMMWVPDLGAFRAGTAFSTEWDNVNIGINSFAFGYDASASGDYSTAIGIGTAATGYSSIAIGGFSSATNQNAVAIGGYAVATGNTSVALGISGASGDYSTAMGYNSIASGNYATALGNYTTAGGYYSTAFGSSTTASGDNSTAMGNSVSTNGHNGSFIIGDNSTATIANVLDDNRMVMRFAGGYKLCTNSAGTVGSQMSAGDNAWSTLSDRRKKENFANVDGELFLKKISKFHLTSWNYKTQAPALYRHYGPMAQDFYAAFGKDKYGTVGNDTTINQADMMGVSFIAIQALEKRTQQLQKENEQLKSENEGMKAEVTSLKNDLTTRIANMEAALSKQQALGKVAGK